MKKKIILMGAPASGKSTLAKKLQREYDVPFISTGCILREEIKKGSPLGKLVEPYVAKGQLVPYEVVNKIVENRLTKGEGREGFILDGFPRTVDSLKEFDKTLEENNIKIDFVVHLDVDDEVIIRRITGRRVCSECGETYNMYYNLPKNNICNQCGGILVQRPDDKEEIVKNRLDEFREITKPVIDIYKERNLIKNIVM